MTRVYGGCIEPGDMDLDDDWTKEPCPECSEPASHWCCERVESGSINLYIGMHCSCCGHSSGDVPDNDN